MSKQETKLNPVEAIFTLTGANYSICEKLVASYTADLYENRNRAVDWAVIEGDNLYFGFDYTSGKEHFRRLFGNRERVLQAIVEVYTHEYNDRQGSDKADSNKSDKADDPVQLGVAQSLLDALGVEKVSWVIEKLHYRITYKGGEVDAIYDGRKEAHNRLILWAITTLDLG